MRRRLTIDVRHRTWPGSGRLPAFPSSFHQGSSRDDIDVPAMLLVIGYLTTPISVTGVSLSEFWAWVRYLAAISTDPDLRLTEAFADLDAHQKTILSDDFGMGVPVLWLLSRLNFDRIVDGRYFMRRIAASVGASQRRTAKRGPNKTPDFVARDTNGKWHVIECKGTQSGHDYCDRQLGSARPIPVGGVAQKRSIRFPPNHTGQRLVCGLSIGLEQESESRLTIIDPEPEKPFELATGQMDLADDAATRGVVSKALRMSGLEIAADVTASPLGWKPETSIYRAREAERQRQEFLDQRDALAQQELDAADEQLTKFSSGFAGRERRFELPRPILVGDDEVRTVYVSQGIDPHVVERLRERVRIAEPIGDDAADSFEELGRTKVDSDERSARLSIGGLFRSEIILQ